MASRNPGHKDMNLLRGWPPVPEEHALCLEAQKKGLKMMQAHSADNESSADAVRALVKPKMPQGQPQTQPSCCHCSLKSGTQSRSYMAKGHRLCEPQPKVQTKAEASAPAQAPTGAQAPVKSHRKGFCLPL